MAERKVFRDSVVPLPPEEGIAPGGVLVQKAEARHGEDSLPVLFSLALPADVTEELEAAVARGEVLPVEQVSGAKVPKADVDRLLSWLKGHGFTVDRVSDDGTSVYARSSVANVSRQLEVDMVRVTRDGVTYNAARNAPSLPSDVGDPVLAIHGLQSYRHVNRHRRMPVTVEGPSPALHNKPPYLVSELLSAYEADDLELTGKGQTIAILIDTVPLLSDLTTFWKRNKLHVRSNRVTLVNVKGGALPPPSGEETMDAEWAGGIAPDADIRVYAAGSLFFVDLDAALDRIVSDLPSVPGLRQLSISLGLGELFYPAGEIATQHQKFLKLAAAGVNVFVSSGDAGSNPDVTGHSPTGPLQVEYSASDPLVVGVGGTSLFLDKDGDVSSETGWPGSGGGASAVFPRPAWQQAPGMTPGTTRLVPDVSLVADPNTGALVILNGQDLQFGGTSLSAPIWAGFCALFNQARVKAHKPPLGFLNPLLYPLVGTKCFRDIVSGSNGAFQAGPGYDEVTGLGVPNVEKLVDALS
jgi:kumamolisin